MKKIIPTLLLLLCSVFTACVDDYQDANPPRPLDGPALFSLNASAGSVQAGGMLSLTANVVDAPGTIASVSATAVDDGGDPAGSFTVVNAQQGQTDGLVELRYEAPANFIGRVTITVAVTDAQTPPKTSAPATLTVLVVN